MKKTATKKTSQNWESLIATRTRPCATICKIEDPVKRNSAAAKKRWRKKNWNHYQEKQKEWREANPEKIKVYQERNKKNVKRWAEEHPERIRELGRRSDRKRANSPKRVAWKKEYSQRPEVKARRAEQSRARELKPERIAWKKAYEEKRKHDPKRIAWKKAYEEKKRTERMKIKESA